MKIKKIAAVLGSQVIHQDGKSTGISTRYLHTGDTLDLLVAAALKLNLDLSKIECLVVSTQTPKHGSPTEACLVQKALGLRNDILILDNPMGCSAYTHSLMLIDRLKVSNCLLLVGDTVASKQIDPTDNSTNQLFSDCGTATYIEASVYDHPKFDCYTNGDTAIVVNDGTMSMNGVRVFKFAVSEVPKSIKRLGPLNVDYIVLHQANKMINDAIIKNVGIKATVLSSLSEYGNTTGSSIPLTLCMQPIKGNLLLSGFGVGTQVCSVYLPNQDIQTIKS